MYKTYSKEDYLCVVDESAERIRNILQTRYDELEELRDAINDRYPFEDLFLKWAEVDDEKKLIEQLLVHLEECAENMKKDTLVELPDMPETDSEDLP